MSPPRDEQDAQIGRMRARVYAEARCAVPLIKALYSAGMIDGWRAVRSVGTDPDRSRSYSGPLLTGRELIRKD